MLSAYTTALSLHQAGRLAEAARWYEAVLAREPNHADALHLLGVLHHQTGQYSRAVELIESALRQRPQFGEAWNNLGLALRKLGRSNEALAAFRTASLQAPHLATAHANLGRLLIDRGQFAEALPHCQQAVRLEPSQPTAHNNLGDAFRHLERYAEAEAAYGEALRLAPHQAQVHANLGRLQSCQGKADEALAGFRRAVELAPENVHYWDLLAYAHLVEGDYTDAIAGYQRIVALEPQQASGHLNLGIALEQEGRLDEAAVCYRRVLELQPGHEMAQVHLANLHRLRGELKEAEAGYRRARADHPSAATPLADLANLLREQLPDADYQAIVDMLKAPTLGDDPRQELLFGLAQVLDARGDFAAAAHCLQQANALHLQQMRKLGRHYDPDDFRRYVGQTIATFTPELFAGLAGAGENTQLPVFVFGLPRSGTSLVEQVLASHPQVHGAGELQAARQVVKSAPSLFGSADYLRAALRNVSRQYLERLQQVLQHAGLPAVPGRVVDKMPENYLYLGFLALLFPQATFIHVRRDLRDVAVSCWLTNFGNIRWASDLDQLAERIREYRRLMAHWQAVLPVAVHEVVYEKLVSEFDTEAPRLVAACGLEWDPACGEFHKTRRPVNTSSATQVRQPLYRKAVARWKHYEPYLGDLFARLPADAAGGPLG
jgi:Flp pilus assembly protein TadD